MSFSVTLNVQRNGRMNLPRLCKGPVSIKLTAFGCRVLTTVSIDVNGPSITVPAALRALMTLPVAVQVEITTIDQAPAEPTLEPLEGSFEFSAIPRAHRGCAHVNVPMSWARSITAWSLVRVEIEGHSAVVELRTNVQGLRGVVVPAEFLGQSRRIRLTRAEQSNVESIADSTMFDWGTVPFDGRRVIDGDRLLVFTQRSQLSIKRLAPIESTMWLLGFWLADGDKEAGWFSVTNKSRVVLGKARDALVGLGVSIDDLRLGVIHGSASRVRTESYFSTLGIKFGAVRHDPGRKRGETHVQREFSGHLSLSGSGEFVLLARAAIDHLKLAEHTPEARKAFLLGYLDGDGTVTAGRPYRWHASCATKVEGELIAGLMDEYLGRTSISEVREDGGCWPAIRTLTGFAAARLISDGAFAGNSARPRLFHFAHRILYPDRFIDLHRRWGFVDENDQPTEQLVEARKLLEAHDHEWQYILNLYSTEDKTKHGVKGVLYEYDPNWKLSGFQKVRRRQAANSPAVHHPEEKRAQINEVLAGLNALMIYEAHPGEGGCTMAYAQHGRTVALQGDDRSNLRTQLNDPSLFDVVDLDPYGYPFNLLLEGALRLLKPTGFLFLTCPNPAKNFRGGSKRIQAALFTGGPNPFDAPAVIELVHRLGLLCGIDLILVSRLDLPSVWRLAFKAEPL